jgi:glycine cleavage system regulatory protein
MSGGVLFEADAVLEAPADLDEATLRAALEAVANELMVEIELER